MKHVALADRICCELAKLIWLTSLWRFGDFSPFSFPSHLRVSFKLCSFLLHYIHYSENPSYWQSWNYSKTWIVQDSYSSEHNTPELKHLSIGICWFAPYKQEILLMIRNLPAFSLISYAGAVHWFLERTVYIYSLAKHKIIFFPPCTICIVHYYISAMQSTLNMLEYLGRGSAIILKIAICLSALVFRLRIFLLKFKKSLMYGSLQFLHRIRLKGKKRDWFKSFIRVSY